MLSSHNVPSNPGPQVAVFRLAKVSKNVFHSLTGNRYSDQAASSPDFRATDCQAERPETERLDGGLAGCAASDAGLGSKIVEGRSVCINLCLVLSLELDLLSNKGGEETQNVLMICTSPCRS